jgi:hypothetical protein
VVVERVWLVVLSVVPAVVPVLLAAAAVELWVSPELVRALAGLS